MGRYRALIILALILSFILIPSVKSEAFRSDVEYKKEFNINRFIVNFMFKQKLSEIRVNKTKTKMSTKNQFWSRNLSKT